MEKKLVWDLPLRLFHWLLVLSVAGLWLTAHADADYLQGLVSRFPDVVWMEWHFRLGYFALGLVLFRLIWGVVGPRHARFASFVPGIVKLPAYLRTVFQRDSQHHAGHNPAGALVVVVMLAMLGAQAVTGLFTSDDIVWSGPWNPAVSGETASLLGSIHHENFEILQWLIALHIVALVFYTVWKRQRLVPAMVTGRKPAADVAAGEEITGSALLRALVVVLLCAGVVYLVITQAPPPPETDFY
ncbi:MAG: hypothetical protein RL026_2581 [Pseudomonadota bacterium]|jgi:cytochrome b